MLRGPNSEMATKRARETKSSHPLLLVPPGQVGGEGQAGEVVARQEPLAGEIAVGVEVALRVSLVDQQLELGLRLVAAAARPHPRLCLLDGVVADDGVLLVSLLLRAER